jgi:hypothetical protein
VPTVTERATTETRAMRLVTEAATPRLVPER